MSNLADFLSLYGITDRFLNDIRDRASGTETLPNLVASGDTTQTSTVLWTRSSEPGTVFFEYSTDADFDDVLGTISAPVSDVDQPVKVSVDNLIPNTEYFYRVTNTAGSSATGAFKTPAHLGETTGLRFGVAPDLQGELAPFASIANADEKDLDFFVFLGDTISADSRSPALDKPQAETLAEFRIKHDEVYSERFGLNTWGDLRSSTSFLAIVDDHEITNDVAGGAPPATKALFADDPAALINDTQIYEDGIQAFQEYNPLRDEFYGDTGDPVTANEPKLYRFQTYGNDAAVFVPDTRSFRSQPLPFLSETASEEATNQFLIEAFNPNKTLLGQVQLEEFKQDLLAAQQAGITWKFVMSSVPIQHFGIPVAGERWEGYADERTEILQFIEDNNIENVVFTSGDFHGNVVNNVTYQTEFGAPQVLTDVIDIMAGPVAIQLNLGSGPFAAPFGPATVAFTPNAVLPPEQKERYRNFTSQEEKDEFVRDVIDARLNKFGYDTLGLEGSEIAGIDANLVQGSYTENHVFSWTEFAIAPDTQQLTVTTYGIEPYFQDELEANPDAITSRPPEIVYQFTLNAKNTITGTEAPETLTGDALNNTIFGLGGNDNLNGGAGNDLLMGGGGSDFLDGGDGIDTASYVNSSVGIAADLKADVVILGFDPDANRDSDPDTFTSVENITGSAFSDTLTGTPESNIIEGGGGADVLTGDGGADTFVYRSPAEGGDIITDFGADDRLEISASGFRGGLGAGIPLNFVDEIGIFNDTGSFVSGASAAPTGTGATFIYDTTTGALSYDIDGVGAIAATEIVTLAAAPGLSVGQIAIVS